MASHFTYCNLEVICHREDSSVLGRARYLLVAEYGALPSTRGVGSLTWVMAVTDLEGFLQHLEGCKMELVDWRCEFEVRSVCIGRLRKVHICD